MYLYFLRCLCISVSLLIPGSVCVYLEVSVYFWKCPCISGGEVPM